MKFDDEMAAIKREHFDRFSTTSGKVWIVEERGADFIVHAWSEGGVAPTSQYPTLRKAAARLLQLLHVGPVAPQTHPETVCIGSVKMELDEAT